MLFKYYVYMEFLDENKKPVMLCNYPMVELVAGFPEKERADSYVDTQQKLDKYHGYHVSEVQEVKPCKK